MTWAVAVATVVAYHGILYLAAEAMDEDGMVFATFLLVGMIALEAAVVHAALVGP